MCWWSSCTRRQPRVLGVVGGRRQSLGAIPPASANIPPSTRHSPRPGAMLGTPALYISAALQRCDYFVYFQRSLFVRTCQIISFQGMFIQFNLALGALPICSCARAISHIRFLIQSFRAPSPRYETRIEWIK